MTGFDEIRAKLDELYLDGKVLVKTAGESSRRSDSRFSFYRLVWESWGRISVMLRRLEAAERYIEQLETPFPPDAAVMTTAADTWRSLKALEKTA